MGGYYTFAEIVGVMDQLRASYPNLVSQKTSIGQSVQGRDIWMFKVSDNPNVDENEPEFRVDSLHHAREPQGMQTTLYFLCYLLEEYGTDPLATYLLDEREIYVVPCVNPDGYEFNRQIAPAGRRPWRKNRRNNGGSTGVDLNRNYPFQWGGSGPAAPRSDIYLPRTSARLRARDPGHDPVHRQPGVRDGPVGAHLQRPVAGALGLRESVPAGLGRDRRDRGPRGGGQWLRPRPGLAHPLRGGWCDLRLRVRGQGHLRLDPRDREQQRRLLAAAEPDRPPGGGEPDGLRSHRAGRGGLAAGPRRSR